jgi:hypothetical protein
MRTKATVRATTVMTGIVVATVGLGPTVSATADPGGGFLPTTWDCANGDQVIFDLPAVAVSPGQGAISAPFPAVLTQVVSGPASMPLGLYQVISLSQGAKTGLAAEAVLCWPDGAPEFGLTVAPASHRPTS